MFIEFDREVIDSNDLKKYLSSKNIDLGDYSPAVITLFLDKNGKILLQRRGPKSRDEFGKLQDIGGEVESSDLTFRDALSREIREEVGNEVDYTINRLVGAALITKFNPRILKNVKWLFLLYECSYISGELKCNEDGKSIGYEWYTYDDLPLDEIAESTLKFWKFYYEKKM